jgi:hypothetical protein
MGGDEALQAAAAVRLGGTYLLGDDAAENAQQIVGGLEIADVTGMMERD